MRRVIAIAFAGVSLAGCSSSSFSSFSLDSFRPKPDPVQVQLESSPPGADAKTSLGPSCKTPCSVSIPAPDAGFSVTFNLDNFLPETVQVQVVRNTGVFSTSPPVVMDPSPVVAELQPAPPPPKGAKRRRPKVPKAAAAPAESAFPDPNQPPPR